MSLGLDAINNGLVFLRRAAELGAVKSVDEAVAFADTWRALQNAHQRVQQQTKADEIERAVKAAFVDMEAQANVLSE